MKELTMFRTITNEYKKDFWLKYWQMINVRFTISYQWNKDYSECIIQSKCLFRKNETCYKVFHFDDEMNLVSADMFFVKER